MKKLKTDWKIATNFERIRFVVVMTIMLAFGGMSIYLLLLAISIKGSNPDEYLKYVGLSLLCFVIILCTRFIKLSPRGIKLPPNDKSLSETHPRASK